LGCALGPFRGLSTRQKLLAPYGKKEKKERKRQFIYHRRTRCLELTSSKDRPNGPVIHLVIGKKYILIGP